MSVCVVKFRTTLSDIRSLLPGHSAAVHSEMLPSWRIHFTSRSRQQSTSQNIKTKNAQLCGSPLLYSTLLHTLCVLQLWVQLSISYPSVTGKSSIYSLHYFYFIFLFTDFFLALSCIVQSIRHEANALFLFFPSKALIAKLITQYKVPKNPKLTTHMLQTHITHCPVLWRSCATLWTNESTHIHKDVHH